MALATDLLPRISRLHYLFGVAIGLHHLLTIGLPCPCQTRPSCALLFEDRLLWTLRVTLEEQVVVGWQWVLAGLVEGG
jgi:hypothetical protein